MKKPWADGWDQGRKLALELVEEARQIGIKQVWGEEREVREKEVRERSERRGRVVRERGEVWPKVSRTEEATLAEIRDSKILSRRVCVCDVTIRN